MKSYTDLEQSRKLDEILPLESADMTYWQKYRPDDYAVTVHNTKELRDGFEAYGIEYIPCWSLSALLEVTSKAIVINKVEGNGKYIFSSSYIGTYTTAQNPIDACYDMIIKLHELNLL